MLNRNEKMEIAKRLRHLNEMEMSRDELEQLLDAELSKPEAEMDAELIEQILELLEDTPSQNRQQASWQKIDKRLSSKHRRLAVTWSVRIAAAAVLMVAIMFATYGTAYAFNWEFLLRLMRPFAETFMVYSGDKPEPAAEPVTIEVYDDMGMEFTQTEFSTLADCPDKVEGYPAKPIWIPERFSYVQGSMYSDFQVTSFSHIFSCADDWCIVDITKFRSNEDATSFYFEQLPEENTSMYVAGYQIAFYRNTHNAYLTASWLAENTHYCITGALSEEETVLIIESMMK